MTVSLRVVSPFALVLATAVVGCSSSDPVLLRFDAGPGSECPGPACTCGGSGGRDCTCADGMRCTDMCTDSCNLDCGAAGSCAFRCESSCNVDCPAGSTCDVVTRESSNVVCVEAVCTARVEASSNVRCSEGSDCQVTCTSSCNLDCRGARSCTLQCAEDTSPRTVRETDQCRDGIASDAGSVDAG